MYKGYQPTRTITIDMMRHGEPEGGVMYRGTKDDPLSETGWEQMRATLNSACDLGFQWEKVVCSPLQRCQSFAREAASTLNIELDVNEGLKELSFGQLEGMRPVEAWEQYPDLLRKIWSDPINNSAPGGESFGHFADRVGSAMDSLIQQPSDKLLLVVHGGVIRAALYNLLKMGASAIFRVDIPYASLTRFQVFLNTDETYEASLSFMNGIR